MSQPSSSGTSLGSEACWMLRATLSSCSTRSRSRICCASSSRNGVMVSALHSSTILPSEARSMTSVVEGAHCDATYHHVVGVGCLILDAVADVREASVLLGGTLYVAFARSE